MILDRLLPELAGSAALTLFVEAAIKGTSLLILAGILVTLLRRASAAHRHLVWACALAGLVALPILLAALPAWRVSAPALAWLAPQPQPQAAGPDAASPAPTEKTATDPTEAMTPPPATVDPATPDGKHATVSRPPSRPGISWAMVVLALWAIGALAVLATFVAGHAMLRLLLRGAHPVRDGEWHALAMEAADRLHLTTPFALLRGDGVLVPVAFGLLRPRVLLPAGADAWPAELRRAVLLHELAHVQRHDCLTQAIAQLACSLFWFHPGVWWASSQLQAERERACDDRVLAARTRASDYADHLLGMVRSLRATRLAALGAVAFARPSSLEGRLLAVLDPLRNRAAVGLRVAAPAALLALLLVLPFAAFEPVAAGSVRVGKSVVRETARDPEALRPSRLTPVPDPGRTLEERVAWARTDAGRSGDPVWWVGWTIEQNPRMRGNNLSDSEGMNLSLLRLRGLFTLEDLLAGREQGTWNEDLHSARDDDGTGSAALLVRMTAGGPDRVRVQSPALPAEFRDEPLFWLESVPEEQTFAWLRTAAERARTDRMRGQLVETISYLRSSERVAPYLLATFQGSGTPRVRANAAEGLARHPSPESVRLLADAARTDRSGEVRRACVEALGKFQTPDALQALLDIARASEGSERRAAFDAIGEEVSRQAPQAEEAKDVVVEAAPAPEAEPEQVEPERRHKEKAKDEIRDSAPDEPSQRMPVADLEVQRQAIESLGRYPEAQSLPRLRRIAETSPNGDLRATAVEAIGRLGTPAALSVIDEIAWKNRQARARQAAVEEMGRRFPADKALDKLDVIARTHPSSETRRMAVEAIGRLDTPRAVEALGGIVAGGADRESMRQAVESLGRRDGEGIERQLMEIARTHRSTEVRRQAVESLGRREGEATVERLMEIAQGDVPREVQRQAAESLGRTGDARAKAMLLELARSHPSIEVERQAVESLARLKADVMGDLAQIARSHPSPEIRRQAVESMTRRDPERALPLLEEILRQPKRGGI